MITRWQLSDCSEGFIFHILIHFYCLVEWFRSLADCYFEEGNTFALLQINSNLILYVPCLMQQDRKCAYYVTLRRVRTIIAAVEKQ